MEVGLTSEKREHLPVANGMTLCVLPVISLCAWSIFCVHNCKIKLK